LQCSGDWLSEGYLSSAKAEGYSSGVMSAARYLEFDDKLYKPTSVELQKKTYGHYMKLVEEFRQKGLVFSEKSMSCYLMLSAMILHSGWVKTIREERQLTEKYLFDTDCLSAFHLVHEESILARLNAGRIILPA